MKNSPNKISQNEFLLILDLSGYSALTDVHGGAAAAKVVFRLTEIVEGIVLPDIIIEERKGDEIILSSKNGISLLKTCFRLQDCLESEHNYPSYHAALHYGEIFRQAGGLFSTTINLTARMASFASAGKIVCSRDFLDNIELSEKIKVKSLGEIKFKNILNPKEMFEIETIGYFKKEKATDPVCKMTLQVDDETIQSEYKGITYHFCSSRCFQYFENHPGHFTNLVKK